MESFGEDLANMKTSTGLLDYTKNSQRIKLLGSFIIILLLFAGATALAQAQTIEQPVFDHFWYDYIPQQTVGHEFNVKIVANDQFGATYTSLSGSYTLSDYSGINTNVDFYLGVGNAKVTIYNAYSNDKIFIEGTIGESNAFNIIEEPVLDHFWYDFIPQQTVGHEFNVYIVAKDQFGATYTSLSDSYTLSDYSGINTNVDFYLGVGNAKVTIYNAYSNDKIFIEGTSGESNTFNIIDTNLWWIWAIAGAIIIILLVAAFVTYKRRKKRSPRPLPAPAVPIKPVEPPKPPTPLPTQLRLSAEPLTIVANGASKSTLTLQLLDRQDKPAATSADLLVKMFASKGKLAQPTITIPKGTSVAKTFIIASTETGSVLVSANAEGFPKGEVALNFKEEEQHCLYCGAVTPSMYEPCPECGRIPP